MARSGRLRSGAGAKLKRWRKGHSSDCNPETRQHRLAARSRFCSRPAGEGREAGGRGGVGSGPRCGQWPPVRAVPCLCPALPGGGCRGAGRLRDEPLGRQLPRARAGGGPEPLPHELQPREGEAANRGGVPSPRRNACVLLTFAVTPGLWSEMGHGL